MKTNSQAWRMIAVAFLRRAELGIHTRHTVEFARSGLCLALIRLQAGGHINATQHQQMKALVQEQTRLRGSIWLSSSNTRQDSLDRAALALLFSKYERDLAVQFRTTPEAFVMAGSL